MLPMSTGSLCLRDGNKTRESRVSIFFLDPGKGISQLLRIETSDHLTIWPIVSEIIVSGRSALAISRSIACLLHCGHGPHTRHMDTAKQRIAAYLSGNGQMFLPMGADNPSYVTASAWQCKCGRFSLPLYTKQERSLFCWFTEIKCAFVCCQFSHVQWKSAHVNKHLHGPWLDLSIVGLKQCFLMEDEWWR